MAFLNYGPTFTVDTDDIQELFEPEEWNQLLQHFEAPEQIADWLMDGILGDYQDELGERVESQAEELRDRLDRENRGQRVYF